MEQLERILTASIPEPNSGCWLWLGSVQSSGHGRLKWRGHTTLAHRVSWIVFNGPIPDGLCVCHKCDVPSCVNPEHLFLGTVADNHADRNAKGRQAKGERNGRARLTVKEVLAIAVDPKSIRAIAREYRMSPSQVCRIKTGESWKHVFDGTPIYADER